jgi:ATP/maltotriose-dependent transcriptional regulator MalT
MGRYGEAETFVREAKGAAGGDVFAEATWRRAAAKIDAARGDVDQAAAMLYDAAAIVRDTDALALQADVQADLAVVLGRLGRNEGASQAVDAAAALYRRKEHAAALGQLVSTFAPVRDGLTS